MTDLPLDWYKDAVIYQLHIKAFFDSNNDGIGDFVGLTEKLDYIKDLGVNTLWVLPFYPSPLRDDGYDISNYTGINPSYGTMHEFRRFVREAHKRDIKVITELVINHTSDQHPWFERARNAPEGSAFRDWYVWSDTDTKYSGTRIIFQDTEKSNWTWDPVAKAYYWHRFFSHQPDLNFDNPAVLKAVIRAMYFWLALGVDGLRLDAIPYLIERDGTSNENLAATHAVLKKLRKALDAKYPDRFFLAEANMWPEDVMQYFGDDDECHMAFHFPLMPRMYMSIAQEDRHPITDIMRQTPEISPNCQWAIFLRNHDELTLEMVTDKERDYLWQTYAADKQARLNLGIRRRLAPLMENDRRKIELMNSLLMSMPGTPIMYYGDEIGMGDNIYLGDRNGVRTPMQWSPDRNGGFSRGDPARMFLPVLMDAVYGYESVNVEAQSRSSSSLLSWMKRLIAVRKSHKSFGRGKLEFLYPNNRQVLCYTRTHEDETILCVANLSRAAQAVELDLAQFKGATPVELIGRSRFPTIGELFYQLTLPPYGFMWFRLEPFGAKQDVPALAPEVSVMPDYITLVVNEDGGNVVTGRNKEFLDRNILPKYLPTQRWFPNKDRHLADVDTNSAGFIGETPDRYLLAIVSNATGDVQNRYFLPIGAERGAYQDLAPAMRPRAFAKARRGPQEALLIDATALAKFTTLCVEAIVKGETVSGSAGTVRFAKTALMPEGGMPAESVPTPGAGEQSNSSVLIRDFGVMKYYRHLVAGAHPELEMGLYLSKYPELAHVPAVLGYMEIDFATGEKGALGVLHAFVENQGDGWTYTLAYLNRVVDHYVVLAEGEVDTQPELHLEYLEFARKLGERTAGLHLALAASQGDPAFDPEPISQPDVNRWIEHVQQRLQTVLPRLREEATENTAIQTLVDKIPQLEAKIRSIIGNTAIEGNKTRFHADYHLGQILVVQNDVVLVDFEGEPKLSIDERRRKASALADVAGMIRSFDYAAWTALERISNDYPDKRALLEKLLFTWRDQTVAAFEDGYWSTFHLDGAKMANPFEAALVKLFLLDRALYEVNYEINNRPAWVHIPISGVNALLSTENESAS